IRTEVERREKECVSYASVWGKDKYAVGRTYRQMHTDYYNEVGKKYGLERGDDISMLPGAERRERVHKNKAVLEAERQAKNAIANAEAQKRQLEQQKDHLVGETQSLRSEKARLEDDVSQQEAYAAALEIKGDDLVVPTLKTDQLIKDAVDAIYEELSKPIPAFGQKEWREERRKAIKIILTEMQDELFNAKEVQKKDILKLGRSLYDNAMKEASAIIEQSKRLQKENGRLAEENDTLRKRIAAIDEKAIVRLRSQKDAEIDKLADDLRKVESAAVRSGNIAYSEHQRAEKAEGQIKEMFDVPEIKEIWESIQQSKKTFRNQIDKWIEDGVAAIMDYANGKDNDFRPEAGNAIVWGIIAEAFESGLDPTDEKQRRMATGYLLEKISWAGIASEFKIELTAARTRQLCDAMTVSKDLMADLLLAAGGRGGISTGGGSNSELTNWDGTKKKNGWGR
ncbi:MAG: hypothetical protein IJV27_08950, partial [Prevotella sp.]|nr:hypothetical protein [Prevotella sp.]